MSTSVRENQRRIRHPTFWAQDGNVILDIDGVLFKLYRVRLAQASQYFTQEFGELDTGAGEGSASVTYDGCVVVSVSGVSPGDFEQLLIALDSGLCVFPDLCVSLMFDLTIFEMQVIRLQSTFLPRP